MQFCIPAQVMDTKDMGSRALCAIIGTLTRPGTAFRTISDNPDHYFKSSVAIFTVACLVSALSPIAAWLELGSGASVGFTGDVLVYLAPFTHTVLFHFLIIAMIFWIGNRHGQRYKFKKIFPVLSYCLTPILLGALIVLGSIPFIDNLLIFVHDDRSGNLELFPEPALDMTKSSIISMFHNISGVFFLAWTFLLFGKAIMVLYGFRVGETIGVLVLVALTSYALRIPLGFLHTLLSSLAH